MFVLFYFEHLKQNLHHFYSPGGGIGRQFTPESYLKYSASGVATHVLTIKLRVFLTKPGGLLWHRYHKDCSQHSDCDISIGLTLNGTTPSLFVKLFDETVSVQSSHYLQVSVVFELWALAYFIYFTIKTNMRRSNYSLVMLQLLLGMIILNFASFEKIIDVKLYSLLILKKIQKYKKSMLKYLKR